MLMNMIDNQDDTLLPLLAHEPSTKTGGGMSFVWALNDHVKANLFTTSKFGPQDPQLWAWEVSETFWELLEGSGSYRETPESPPHGNP